jgi:hypothetical protein
MTHAIAQVHPTPLRLSDDEQRALDELRGDWPPAEALDDEGADPADWREWADEFRFEPSEEDARWAAEEFNALDLFDPARDATGLDAWLATAAPDPEPTFTGRHVSPAFDTPTGGID